MIFYSLHYAKKAGSAYIEPEHILEGLLLEDPRLFKIVLPERPNLVKDLQEELATRRANSPSQTKAESLPLSPTAKKVVATAGTEQLRLGHTVIAPQHLLLALLRARKDSTWFRRGIGLPVQLLLSKHGITPQLAEEKTKSGIVTPSSWVLDDGLVALNGRVAALAELLIERRIFSRAEFVSLLDRNEGPVVPEVFISPLIDALEQKGILTAAELEEPHQEESKAGTTDDKEAPDERNLPPSVP